MKSLANTTIGIIGLGNMGKPMARNLTGAGANVHVASRSPGPVAELASEGMTAHTTPASLAAAVDCVIIMVSDTAAVDSVLHGPDGVIGALDAGKLMIDMGTTDVAETRLWAGEVTATGAAWLDAPVSGGQVGAEAGTLSIMVGGDAAALARAQPILDVFGANITHIGDTGAGQVAKTANQVIVGLTLAAVAEALTLADRAGADPAKVRAAITGGFADSRILDLHGGRMIDRAFTPGGTARVQHKDIVAGLRLAEQSGLALPSLETNLTLWQKMLDRGWDGLDQSGIIRAIEEA